MLVENFLKFCSARSTRRYLTSSPYPSNSPPKPDKRKSYLLYIHIPFCDQICPYCSFVRVEFEKSLASRYFQALKKEIQMYHESGYRFNDVYVGGGTPTIMPDKLAAIIEYVKSISQIRQISVETNPNHLTDDVLNILKNAGVSRLSVGVQSFNNEILKSVQRLQKYGSAEQIAEALSSVTGMFETVNVDMIFNFPNQTDAMIARDIQILNDIKPDQVTWYPLMVSTGQEKQLTDKCGKVDYRREKHLYNLIVKHLGEVYQQRSVWCFAQKKGSIDEYIIDHDEYISVGSGSWGYIDGTMYSNTFSIPQYIERLSTGRSPIVAYRPFSTREQMRYDLLLRMLDDNLTVARMKKKYGNRFWIFLAPELLFLIAIRAMTFRKKAFPLTPRGRYYSLMLMRNFFSIVGDYRASRTIADAI